jgi:hypothetical protein
MLCNKLTHWALPLVSTPQELQINFKDDFVVVVILTECRTPERCPVQSLFSIALLVCV